jgi:tetratricopeptide (TPR) repeat protein
MLWYQIEPIISYYEVGNYDKVMEITQSIFDSENKANSELHWLRGLIYESQGVVEMAEQEFNLAILYNEQDYWRVNLH